MFKIKQRELRETKTQKPKKQITYHGQGSWNGSTLYEEGLLLLDIMEDISSAREERQYESSGNGEHLTLQFFIGDDKTYLNKWDIKGNLLNKLEIAPANIGSQESVDNKSMLTYLAKPFRTNGNDERYCIVTFYDSNWRVGLINLETNNIIKKWGGSSKIYKDYTFNGIDTIYHIAEVNNKIYKVDINSATGTQEVELLDDNNDPILATTIYGMVDDYIIYRAVDTFVKNYQISTRKVADTTQPSTNMVLLANGISILCFVNEVMYFFSNPFNAAGSVALTQSLVDAGVINAGEIALYPVAITNYKEDNGVVTIDWILWREGFKSVETLKTTINNSIATTQRFTPFGENVRQSEFIINNINNVKQTFNKGLWYRFGLQKQWDIYRQLLKWNIFVKKRYNKNKGD